MATTKDILNLINNSIAPFSLAEEWDNSGLQVGNPAWQVKKILVALDVSKALLDKAEKWNASLILTHHPLLIKPIKSIDFNSITGDIIYKAAQNKISIISSHTSFDKAENGLNDLFAEMINLKNISCLEIKSCKPLENKKKIGLGRKGELEKSISPVAVCTGSGGSLMDDFFKSKADVFVTGDIKYHEARDIENKSLGLIDVGHFKSEHIGVNLIVEKLKSAVKKAGFNIKIKGFEKEKDPFYIL
ncbi:MAG: Nif3-like dinuclear metal center hexameric protein [Desulfobacteraceae bacterium 4572_130]|nr:MAG: Nif3-like dinuclear metal center hexameric protein [Desulfobacteraceae bacterium 4572_130]